MKQIFLLLTIVATLATAAPLYGQDGGYKGYASYKPMNGGTRGVLQNLQPPIPPMHPDRNKNVVEGTNILNGDIEQLVAQNPFGSQRIKKTKAVTLLELDDVMQYDPVYLQEPNQALTNSPSAPHRHTTQYGSGPEGYKIADVTGNNPRSTGNFDNYGQQDIYQPHPQPYEYGYIVKDDGGHEQYKQEASNGEGVVQGSYGFRDPRGLYRQVHYVADKTGFRANIKTNEPGTEDKDPASVKIEVSPEHSTY